MFLVYYNTTYNKKNSGSKFTEPDIHIVGKGITGLCAAVAVEEKGG